MTLYLMKTLAQVDAAIELYDSRVLSVHRTQRG
jgi:hypothetical protein